MEQPAYTLSQVSARITQAIASDPMLRGVWVVAETVDVRVSGGHCYLELVEKDQYGRAVARARATIWASVYQRLSRKFFEETGQELRSDLKVMVYATVGYHPLYGLALNISAINPSYTLGDAMRLRNEMIDRLTKAGIIEQNRRLPWPALPQRVAIISAPGAAGYGDFINQLCNNASHIRFHARLFPAIMQGDRTAPTIIAALEEIAAQGENWDCVVIIRGGGSTSDLAAFDNYELAERIALFEIPVVIGIGHERDITLLDYVANMRVKTPTAAAEWLIGRGEQALARLQALAQGMLQAVTDRLVGSHRQLSYIAGVLPAAAQAAAAQARQRVESLQQGIGAIADRRLRPQHARLDGILKALAQSAVFAIARADQRLASAQRLIGVLSPEATLRRGYTITRVNGRAVSSPAEVPPGAEIETTFASGTLTSVKIIH